MKVYNISQRSPDWHTARLGIPTASQFDRIITPQGKASGQARKYLYELAYERLTEKPWKKDLSGIPHVAHGIANEQQAVDRFEELTGLKTEEVGFITTDDGSAGCSPDRLIFDSDQALECKCPTGPTHLGYLIDGLDAYKAQIQGQMLIGAFSQIHFFSWHPEFPPYYQRVLPDPNFLRELSGLLARFTVELEAAVAHVRALGNWPANTLADFPPDDDE